MSTSYPGTIQSFVNPVGTNTLDDPDHAGLHSDVADTIEAIQAVVGTTAGTSVLKDFSAGEFPVRQEGGTVSPGTLTFDSPVINDATLGTPAITGGTATGLTLAGTPVLDSTSAVPFYNDSIHRQAIINGNFDVWQRGTSFTTTGYTADRFRMSLTGSSCTLTQQTFTVGQTDVPKNPTYYLRAVVTSSAGASNKVSFYQPIENVANFSGENVTLSFYAKADASKNIAIEFIQAFGSGGSAEVNAIGAQKIALTTSWVKQTITVAIPSISGKTVGAGSWIGINFYLDAGSSLDARTDSLGQQSGTFEFSQVQLCAGEVALPFMPKSFEEELRACQRYYQKSYVYGTAPGTITTVGAEYKFSNDAYFFQESNIKLKQQMRLKPTITFYSPDTGAIDKIRNSSDASDLTFTDALTTSKSDSTINLNGTGTLTSGKLYLIHWTASAEL